VVLQHRGRLVSTVPEEDEIDGDDGSAPPFGDLEPLERPPSPSFLQKVSERARPPACTRGQARTQVGASIKVGIADLKDSFTYSTHTHANTRTQARKRTHARTLTHTND
jgi:hypothetical protein